MSTSAIVTPAAGDPHGTWAAERHALLVQARAAVDGARTGQALVRGEEQAGRLLRQVDELEDRILGHPAATVAGAIVQLDVMASLLPDRAELLEQAGPSLAGIRRLLEGAES